MELEGQRVSVALSRSRRRTVGMSLQDGYVKVVAPAWVPLDEIGNILQHKSRWLSARLRDWQHRQANRLEPEQQWADNAEILFLGQPCRLSLSPEIQEVVWDAQSARLVLPLSVQSGPDQVRDRVHGWLQAQAKEILKERLDMLSARSGRGYARFSLTHARTRWGSCTQDGHIRLNWRLVQFSLPVIDYVVAHELAHLRAMDHSPDFWQEVETILPGYKQAQAQLKGVTLDI
jgi:predicted metal-dependent hydrolase